MEGSVEPCLVEFFGECCGGVCKNNGRLLMMMIAFAITLGEIMQ